MPQGLCFLAARLTEFGSHFSQSIYVKTFQHSPKSDCGDVIAFCASALASNLAATLC